MPSPDLRDTAKTALTALQDARARGLLPAETLITVCGVEPDTLVVSVGGLTDQFVMRGIVGRDVTDNYTRHALRVHDDIVAVLRERLPRKESGELWHAFRVRLLAEAVWRAPNYPGETALHHPNTRKASK